MASLPDSHAWLAHGDRGVIKLLECLSGSAATVQSIRSDLATLNGLLSNQENKMRVIGHAPPVLPVFTRFLSHHDDEIRRQAALAVGSVSLVFQGRIAVRDAQSVSSLAKLVSTKGESSKEVREASASALMALATSRDGCSALMDASGIVTTLVEALDDEHRPVVSDSLYTLASLGRLDFGITEALTAEVVPRLAGRIDPEKAGGDKEVLNRSLQTLANIANTPDGKTAAIDAKLMPLLTTHVKSADPETRRLAAGCLNAITINKQGKLDSLTCAAPLANLLFQPDAAAGTARAAIGTLKNISEYPAARKQIDKYAKEKGLQKEMKAIFTKPVYDDEQWPASLRYQHQNVAPGGLASDAEAAQRARWAYPEPFNPSTNA